MSDISHLQDDLEVILQPAVSELDALVNDAKDSAAETHYETARDCLVDVFESDVDSVDELSGLLATVETSRKVAEAEEADRRGVSDGGMYAQFVARYDNTVSPSIEMAIQRIDKF